MRKPALPIVLALTLLTMTVGVPAFANSPPVVTEVWAEQRLQEGNMLYVHYKVNDADGDRVTVRLLLSEDAGATFPIICASVMGHVGPNVLPGDDDKFIWWDAMTDYPGHVGSDYVVRVDANTDFRITDNPSDAAQPAVGVGADRLARIVWSDNQTGSNNIFWAVFDAAGTPVAGPVQLNTSGSNSNSPRISVDAQNRSFIVWREGTGVSTPIHFARVSAAGVVDIGPVQISQGGTCVYPDIATTPAGVSHIVYERTVVIHYMEYRVVDENGAVIRTIDPGNFDILGIPKYPSVTLDPSGASWMLWKDVNNFTEGLYVASYNSAGVEQTRGRIYVGDDITWTAPLAPRPSWVWFLFQDSPSSTVDHIYSWLGTSTPADQVSPDPGPAKRPRIAGVDGHEVYAVWEDYGSGTSVIKGQGWVASDGSLIPGIIQVSDGTAAATTPDIATDGDGQYYVVWRDIRDGNGEIYMATWSPPEL